MATPPLSAAPRRLDLEGLRGLAVLLVVCFHAGLPAFSGAFVAVDVFFVLSGFFLTRTLAAQIVADEEIALHELYARRIWRLLPALTVVLLATLASAMLLYAPIDRAAVAGQVAPVSFFAGNLAFAAAGVNYFSAAENPLLHTWTLGVEYQLALFFPALVVLLAAAGRRCAGSEEGEARRVIVMRTVLNGIALAGVMSFALAVWTNESAPMWAYFGPHTRLWAFCAGGALAFFFAGSHQPAPSSGWRGALVQLIGLTAIFVPALLFTRNMPYPGGIALIPVTGSLLVVAGGASGSTIIGRLLGIRPLAWLGKVSYPWYLWHWPMMVLGAVLFPTIGPWGKVAFALFGLWLAVISQRWIDQASRSALINRARTGNALMWAAGVGAALAMMAHLSAKRSEAFVAGSVHQTFAAARQDRMDHGCWIRSVAEIPAEACAFGDTRSATTLALVGDSHAEHWLGGLDRAGVAHGWRIEAHVMGGCPVSDFSGLVAGATARRFRACAEFREAALARLVRERPTAVILSSFDSYIEGGEAMSADYHVDEFAWTVGLRRTYARLADAGIPVIVIRGTPRVPFDVPTCLSRRAANLPLASDCSFTPDRDFQARARAAQDRAALGLDVRFVDFNDLVCNGTRCATDRGGLVVFTDDNHLTASFSRSLAPTVGARIGAALAGAGGQASLAETAIGIAKELAPLMLSR